METTTAVRQHLSKYILARQRIGKKVLFSCSLSYHLLPGMLLISRVCDINPESSEANFSAKLSQVIFCFSSFSPSTKRFFHQFLLLKPWTHFSSLEQYFPINTEYWLQLSPHVLSSIWRGDCWTRFPLDSQVVRVLFWCFLNNL